MDYKKKLKARLNTAIIMISTGIIFIVFSVFSEADMASTFGAVFLVMGIARVVQYRRLLNDPEEMRRREIIETDERNVMLWTKARSLAFVVYIIALGIAVIALQLMEMTRAADIVSLCLMGFVVIYWVCYFIIVKKN
ncbi:MAG: hypothetical protein IJB30_03270 [Clostridia bacterium]|nr:hypothetical protein [Clostridia bacterium]